MRKTMRTICAVSSAALASSLMIAAPASADAEQKVDQVSGITSEAESKMTETFDSYNVPEETQAQLLEKLNKGETWDSTIPEEDPVSVEELPSGEVLETYSDGSILATYVQEPNDTPSDAPATRGVSSCTAVPGSNGYKRRVDCLVSLNWVIINQSFEADYEVKSGAPGRITDVYNPVYWVSPGPHFKEPTLNIHRSASEGNAPAEARLTNVLAVGFGDFSAGHPFWIQLNVTTSAWLTHN